MLNGSFSPHTEGGGLVRLSEITCDPHDGTLRNSPLVNVFDVGGKDTGLHVRASCSEQDVVWVPIDRKNCRTDWLLELLRDPPIVVWVERANGDGPLIKGSWVKSVSDKRVGNTHLAPLATANLSSNGLQRTKVAARLMRNRTRVGFQTVCPVRGSGACCHT